MLTRGYIAPGSGGAGGGITEGQHELLDTLVHKLSESYFKEFLYTGKDVTSIITWTDAGKTLKIREVALSYTLKNLTGQVVTHYDGVGSTVATLTRTLAYTGKDLISDTTVRT